MSAAVLLARARASGMALWADGAKLRWRAATPPPPDLGELLGLLRDHKPDVLRALHGGWFGAECAVEAPPAPAAADAPDASAVMHDAAWWRDYFEERAAIREYDGGMSRADAEAGTFADCVARWRALNPLPASGDGACVQCGKARPDTPGAGARRPCLAASRMLGADECGAE